MQVCYCMTWVFQDLPTSGLSAPHTWFLPTHHCKSAPIPQGEAQSPAAESKFGARPIPTFCAPHLLCISSSGCKQSPLGRGGRQMRTGAGWQLVKRNNLGAKKSSCAPLLIAEKASRGSFAQAGPEPHREIVCEPLLIWTCSDKE